MENSVGLKSFNSLSDELKEEIEKFNKKEDDYKNLRLSENISSLSSKVVELQDWVSVFTNIYIAIFKEALREDEDGHRKKTLDVAMMMINKIQYIYLMPASEQEGVLKDKKNLNVAYSGIILSILLALFSIFYPIWDGMESQNRMFDFLQKSKAMEEKIIHQDSILQDSDNIILKNQTKKALVRHSRINSSSAVPKGHLPTS